MKKYDLLTEIEKIKSIKTRNGKITSLKNSFFKKMGLRKFVDGYGYSFSYFGDILADDFVKNSEIVLDAGIPIDFMPLAEFQSNSFVCKSTQTLNFEKWEESIQAIEKALEPYRERFSLEGSYSVNQKTKILNDENKNSLQSTHLVSTHWYSIKRNGSPTIGDGYFWNATLNLTPEYTVECLKKILDGYDTKVTLPPGDYPVLFAQHHDAEESLFEKIKSSLVANNYYENAGLFSGKLGTAYFDERFNLVDSNMNPSLGVFAPFDGEGFIRSHSHFPLIEKGIIKNVIADQRLAKKYKIQPTGNGIRDFKSSPKAAFNRVEVLPGEKSTEQILKSLPQCVVVMMSWGGDFTDIGDYSRPVEFSYLFEFGECVGRLAPITVQSNINKMFGCELIEISSDNFFKSGASPSVFMNMNVLIN